MTVKYLFAGLLFSFFAACAVGRREVLLNGEVDTSNPKIKAGQEAFMTHCDRCHPRGSAGKGPSINDKPLPGFMIKFQVRHGLGEMPSFKKNEINSKELSNIVAYLKALRKSGK